MHRDETRFVCIDTKLDSCAKVFILSFCAKHVSSICTNKKYIFIYTLIMPNKSSWIRVHGIGDGHPSGYNMLGALHIKTRDILNKKYMF